MLHSPRMRHFRLKNKAAGTRARKTSLELEKLMKEFRKLSLEESKK